MSSVPPRQRLKTPSQPLARATSLTMSCTATAVSGVNGDGFQIIVSPQTAAIMAFQAQTATGKLNAVMIPIGPSGCHCSSIRWLGRSLAMVRPYNCRDRPTAKSHMSIISWTSPSPSVRILPVSRVTSRPRSDLRAESRSDLADDLATAGRRDQPPRFEHLAGTGDDPLVIGDRGHANRGQGTSGRRVRRVNLGVSRALDPVAATSTTIEIADSQTAKEVFEHGVLPFQSETVATNASEPDASS